MRDCKIKFQLWDPLILEHDHKELNELGIKTLKVEPKNVGIALLCVRHEEFNEFLNKFHGVLYDYKNVIGVK